ncbi:unnamed protein product, partial [Prorocentrum cordatum]
MGRHAHTPADIDVEPRAAPCSFGCAAALRRYLLRGGAAGDLSGAAGDAFAIADKPPNEREEAAVADCGMQQGASARDASVDSQVQTLRDNCVISRLFTVRGVQPGVPGLRLEHFLFDSMHVADLGILAYFMATVLWLLVRLGYFGNFTDADHDEVDVAMSDALKQYYKAKGVPDRERQIGLKVQMLGDENSPYLKLKAGKSRSLLPFVVFTLRQKGGRDLLDRHDPVQLDGTKLLTVGEGMVEYYAIMKSQPRNMEELALLQLQAVVDRTMNAWIATGRSCQMKWHVFGKHIVDQARWAGNPAWSHNYRGESENFDTRKRAASINRTKFAVNSLVKWYLSYLQKQALIDEIARLLQQLRDADAARTQALESKAQEIRALHIETYELGEELAAMRIILNQVAPDRLVQHDREFSVQMRIAALLWEALASRRRLRAPHLVPRELAALARLQAKLGRLAAQDLVGDIGLNEAQKASRQKDLERQLRATGAMTYCQLRSSFPSLAGPGLAVEFGSPDGSQRGAQPALVAAAAGLAAAARRGAVSLLAPGAARCRGARARGAASCREAAVALKLLESACPAPAPPWRRPRRGRARRPTPARRAAPGSRWGSRPRRRVDRRRPSRRSRASTRRGSGTVATRPTPGSARAWRRPRSSAASSSSSCAGRARGPSWTQGAAIGRRATSASWIGRLRASVDVGRRRGEPRVLRRRGAPSGGGAGQRHLPPRRPEPAPTGGGPAVGQGNRSTCTMMMPFALRWAKMELDVLMHLPNADIAEFLRNTIYCPEPPYSAIMLVQNTAAGELRSFRQLCDIEPG